MSKLRHLLAALCLTSMTFVMVAGAAEPPKVAPKTDDAKAKVEELSHEQDRLKRQYDELTASLLRLAQRLNSSSKQEDKDKAKAIYEALSKASDLSVESKFNALITGLKGANVSKDLDQLQSAIDRNDDLQKDIRAIIELLMRDNKAAEDAKKAAELREMLERLNEIIKKQERHQAKVELGRQKGDDLAKQEGKIKDATKDVLDPNAKKNAPGETKKAEGKPNPNGKEGKPGESKPDAEKPKADARPQEGKGSDNKDNKAESKPGEGKDSNDGKPSEAKPGEGKDNKDSKPGEGKPGEGKDNKDSKPSDSKGGEAKNDMGKEAKPGESKSGESKPGEGKPGEGKPGEGKDNKDSKPGEGKPGEGKDNKDSKPSDSKGGEAKPGMGKPSEGKPNEGKGGEPKPGEAKPSESKNGGNKPNEGAKPGEGKPGAKPGEGKPGEGKPGEAKPGEPKPGEAKGGEGKPGMGKPSEGKPSDSKGKGDGKGEAKPGEGKPGMGMPGEGKPSESKGGESKPGMGGAGKPSEGKPSDSPSGQPGKPGKPGEQTPAEQAAARKQIEEAIKSQEKAIEKLKKDDKPGAEDDEADAADKLKSAKKKLEELLRQLREEEVERILEQLQTRCEQMLAMQIKVRDDTLVLDKAIKSNADGKPTRTDEQTGLSLSDNENKIVVMSEKAIEIIEAEGSAVAFAEVFKQVRTDMKHIEVRLRKTDAGTVTVVIENDVIASLEDMIEALKKARKENKEQKPPPPKPGEPQGPKPPQDLINEIAELKMIRAMQVRVNNRTTVYGKQYNSEQLPPPPPGADKKDVELYQRIEGELRDLGARQTKIEKVTRDIATGKNKTN